MGLLDDAIREHLELKRRRGGDPAEIERAEREALGPVRREPEPIQPASYDEPAGAEPELAGYEDEDVAAYEPLREESQLDEFELYPGEPGGLSHERPPYPEETGGLSHEEVVHPGEVRRLPREADAYAEPPGALPPEPEPPLPHGMAGVGPEEPSAPESVEMDEEHDPWVARAPGESSAAAMPHEEAAAMPHEEAAAMPHEQADAEPFAAPRPDPLPEPSEPPAGPPPVAPPPPGARDHLNQETAEYRLEHGEEEPEDVLEETPEFLQDAPEHDRLWFEQRPPRDFDFDS